MVDRRGRAADHRRDRSARGPLFRGPGGRVLGRLGLVFGGVAELISAYSSSDNRLWKTLLGLLYLFAGIYILIHPGSSLLALALMLAWVFLVQGVISILGALRLRPVPGWGWWLFDGVITLLLAFLIFSGWPQNSVRIIALLVGIVLIISGANRLAWAFAH
jgi:uncharacterized membrane protein HdeD (DUF308 family)